MDEYFIDKAQVRASFNRAAKTYDAAAVLQKKVREELLSRLDLIKINPNAILDAGCGTGHGGYSLQKRFKGSTLFSLDMADSMLKKTQAQRSLLHKFLSNQQLICGDIESLPLADARLDLVWSNLAIQWCNDLDESFSEFMRVLKPNGLFIFSTFGPDTLRELRTATNNGKTHVNRFIDMHDIGDALTRAGFSSPVLDTEYFTLTYESVKNVMQDLKAIGAHNTTQGRGRGLAGKGFLQHLTTQYEQFRTDTIQNGGKLPATFEVVYGHAWKPLAVNPKQHDYAPINFLNRKPS